MSTLPFATRSILARACEPQQQDSQQNEQQFGRRNALMGAAALSAAIYGLPALAGAHTDNR